MITICDNALYLRALKVTGIKEALLLSTCFLFNTFKCIGRQTTIQITFFCKMALLNMESNYSILKRKLSNYNYRHVIIYFSFSQSPGGVPYPTLTNSELYRLLDKGYRMERPDMCSDDVYVS